MEPRQRILHGSDKLFRKFGIRSVSMDDIARELGMSKKTIYSFFSNKADVVFWVTADHLAQEREQFTEIHEQARNSIEEFVFLMECLKKTFSDISPSMIYDVQKYYPKAWELFTKFKYETIHQHIVETLEKGMAEGNFRQNINIKIIARLRVEEIEMAFNENYFPSEQFDPAEVQLELFSQFFHGITTIKGRKLINQYMDLTEDE